MKFVIAGCGIGGLSAGHALSRLGHTVTLIDQAPQLKPVGAGISLQPNAMQALRRLGLNDAISDAAWEADKAEIKSDTGKIFTRFDFSNYLNLFDFLPQTIYRGDLIRVLAAELDNAVTNIVLNESVESFDVGSDHVLVTTSSGAQHECHGLIGADGIHSTVRAQLWGQPLPKYAGYTCWRGMVTQQDVVEQVDVMTEVWGSGARFGFMRCNARQVYWFATENRKQRTDHIEDHSWKSRFKSWPDPIPTLISATTEADIVHNDIVDLDPIFPWGSGKVTLLGDAAHAMTPNFGQGGAQAIEDAVVLGLALENFDNVNKAFRNYESARNNRTRALVKGSRQFGMIGQGGNILFRTIRNFVMPNLPKKFVDSQLGQQCDFEACLRRIAWNQTP